MQFSIVTVLALAATAFAAPSPLDLQPRDGVQGRAPCGSFEAQCSLDTPGTDCGCAPGGSGCYETGGVR